eukprot:Phypoly_transcript_14644.p1 GENE.Phypoly_transcript_14644~~Phypoly_transcript_14644.p1  ORF type:complete len:118 (+),score=17.12 Phypoly_transcript_14644:492-845(+)
MQPTLEFHEKLRGRKGDGTSVAIKKEAGSNLIPSLLKLSFCPTHKSEGMLGWKVCTNSRPCRTFHSCQCSKTNPCHMKNLVSSCGCIDIAGNRASTIAQRHDILKTMHDWGEEFVYF